MILKLILFCSLFLLTASQEDDDAGKKTAEDDSASQPISYKENQDSEENAASQTNSSEIVGGNRAIGRSAKGLRWGWSSWCDYYGCPADHYGTVHPQCCQDSHYCITQRANCQWQRNQINHINNYYGGLVRQVWVWCAATQTWKSMLKMQQPRVVNTNLLDLGAGSNDVRVTYCRKIYGTWQPVTNNVAVGQLSSGQQQQIKHASCGYVAHEEGQVTPTCADLAKNCGGSHRSWVTIASWDLKWCKSKVGGWWNWWTLKRNQKYGGCCWNSYYRTRASQCSWTESTG